MLTDNILDLIGNTPLIQLKKEYVYAKAEFLNTGVRLVAVEPKDDSALLGHEPGLHQIQGIGDGPLTIQTECFGGLG